MRDVPIPPNLVQDPSAKGGNGRDPERTPMQWNAAPNAGFSVAETTWLPVADDYEAVNVATQSADPDSFLSLYKNLIRLRVTGEAFRHGDFKIANCNNKHVLAFTRSTDDSCYLILINFSKSFAHCKTNIGQLQLVLSCQSNSKLEFDDFGKNISLGPQEAAIFIVSDYQKS